MDSGKGGGFILAPRIQVESQRHHVSNDLMETSRSVLFIPFLCRKSAHLLTFVEDGLNIA